MLFRERKRFLFIIRDENMLIRSVPGWDLMAPPKLTRDAPRLNVLEPLEVNGAPVFWNKGGFALADGFERGLGQRFGVDIPLIGKIRLDNLVRALAIRHLECVRLNFLQEVQRFEIGDDLFSRDKAIEAAIGFRNALVQLAGLRHDVDDRQIMTAADLEVVKVMRGRNLYGAGALFWVRIVVRDDRNFAPGQRENYCLSDIGLPALIVRIDGNCRVAQHRFRTRCGDRNVFLFQAARIFDGIFEIPEVPLGLDRDHFKIRNRGLELRVPVDQALIFVDKPFAIKLDENLDHSAAETFVHCETLARPIARRAKALELIDDRSAGLIFPRPDALQKLFTPKLAAAGLLALHKLPFDKTLRCNSGVIR